MPADSLIIHNMPSMMATEVSVMDGDGNMSPDKTWHASVRETFFHLFKFLQDNKLVARKLVKSLPDTDKVVLLFGELTPEGKAFIMSLATERWLASFDRPGSKKSRDDVRYLEKQLQKMRE